MVRAASARREDVVDAPADIPLAQVAPWRPPGEQAGFYGVDLAARCRPMSVEMPLEELALLGPLSDDLWLSLLRMEVDVCTRDVEVPAQDEFAARFVQRFVIHVGKRAQKASFASKSLPPFGT